MSLYSSVRIGLYRLFRFVFHRRGYGIHSPFVFRFITTVVEERMPYYAFSLLRARWTGKGRGGWSWRELELIFRLTDRMHCTSCLLIGQDTDAVLSYATTANSRVRVEKSESLILGNVRDFDLIILQDWKQDMADSRFLPVPFQKNKGEQIYLFNLRTGPCRTLWHKILDSPSITVSIDLGGVGIAFAYPQLNKRHYNAYV